MKLSDVEDLIIAAIVFASGLSADGESAAVIWQDQSVPSPSTDHIQLIVQTITKLSPASPTETQRDNPTPVEGSEILIGVEWNYEISVRVNYYAQAVSGTSSALEKLRATIARLDLEEPSEDLETGGLVYVEGGEVQNVSAILETQFESRAICDLRFRCVMTEETDTTYIESADVSGTYNS